MLYKVGGFVTGGMLSTGLVLNMDDLIYGQFRRNIILPMMNVLYPQNSGVSLDDVIALGQGSRNFAAQFKPQAMGPTNVKALLMNDNDYSTPQDHYFGYINTRKGVDDKKREREVLSGLGLETLLSEDFQKAILDDDFKDMDEEQKQQLVDENN